MPEQLTHRMYEFEVEPPHTTWETIAARLDDDAQYSVVTTKLNNYNVQPPTGTWNNILASLEETKLNDSAPPLVKIGRKIYRFAAAAILVGLFIGGWILLNKTDSKIEVAVKGSVPAPAVAEQSGKVGSKDQQNDTAAHTQKDKFANAAVKTDRYSLPLTDNNGDKILKYAIVNTSRFYNKKPITVSFSPVFNKPGAVILATNSSYLYVAGPGGQQTRISSRFAHVIRYLNAEEYIGDATNESIVWKKRFREWRNKISHSGFIPSSANFLDIIELKELIGEK
jgi:hypothetical protein